MVQDFNTKSNDKNQCNTSQIKFAWNFEFICQNAEKLLNAWAERECKYKCKFLNLQISVHNFRIGFSGAALTSIPFQLRNPNHRSIWNNIQPAIQMTNEIQILCIKWIDCITTNAWRQWMLCLCASTLHIMTLTLAYIQFDWEMHSLYCYLNSSG